MKLRGFIISGLLLAALGIMIIVFAATRNDFKDSVINSSIQIKELSYSTSQIENIRFEADVENLIVKESDNNEIKIVSKSNEYFSYTFNTSEETKTLTIKQEDDGDWFRFDLFGIFEKTEIKYEIYLPRD